MRVATGLDRLLADPTLVKGKRIGVVCNQASIASDCRHILDHVFARKDAFDPIAIFGPQHGLFGHTQDNMIEWEGYRDPLWDVPVYSLYGETRKPTPNMLDEIECIVFDVQDVGARYYTFIWTLSYVMEACVDAGIPVVVLDRPNPIGGIEVEGPMPLEEYSSFVGRFPIAVRHGMTVGEIAKHLATHFIKGVDLTVVEMTGWSRNMMFADTGLPWTPPSPNMPTPQTARVYPGGCLLEGTQISEGRGTTRPFEMFGAVGLDGRRFAERLNRLNFEDFFAQPISFQPTFHKFHGDLCEGVLLHAKGSGRNVVAYFLCAIADILHHDPNLLSWALPPYEYEYIKAPFDILIGDNTTRDHLAKNPSSDVVKEWTQRGMAEFMRQRAASLIYSS